LCIFFASMANDADDEDGTNVIIDVALPSASGLTG
jgi:hypothetical protein